MSNDISYVDYVYDVVKDSCKGMDAIYADHIVELVGTSGLNELVSNRLIESCGVLYGRKLYALLDKEK